MAGRYGASDAPRIDATNPLETPAPLRTIGPVRAVTTPLSDVVAAPFAVGADTGCVNAALRVTGGGHFTARVGIGVCPTTTTPGLEVAGPILPSADNTYSLGTGALRFSDLRSVLATFTSMTGTLLTAAQPNVTSVGTLTALTVTPGTTAVQALTATTVLASASVQANGVIFSHKDGSNTYGSGSLFQLENAAGNRAWAWQLDASNNVMWGYYGGASFATMMTLSNAGALVTTAGITATTGAFSSTISATQATLSLGGTQLITNHTGAAAGTNIAYTAQRGGVSRWSIGFTAADIFALKDAGATNDNLTVTDAGALAVRAGITCTTLAGTGAISGFTSLALSAGITGVTTIAMNGALTGATTGAFSSTLSCTTLTGTLNGGQAGGTVAPTTGTTVNPADINQGSSGATLARSTSSKEFKTNIRDMSYNEAEKFVLGLRSVTFNSLCDMDDPSQQAIGAIAEEVHALDSRFVRLIDGKPVNVFYDWIPMAQNVVIKSLLTRIAALERLVA